MQTKWILLTCAAVRLAAASDLGLELAPPNTKAVFGARVKGIADSELFRAVAQEKAQVIEEWTKLISFAGFNPLRDIDEVVIAASGDNRKSEGLVILRGRFNLERMATDAAVYRGVPLLGGRGDTSVMALLDGETAIAGSRAIVRAAIDRRGQPATLDAGISARVESLRGRFDLWGLGESVEGMAPEGVGSQALDSLDRFEFGVRMSDGFEIAAELHLRTPQDAQKISESLGSIGALMGAAGANGPKLDVQVKDGSVKFSMAISAEQMKHIVAAQVTGAGPGATGERGMPVRSGPPVIIGGDVVNSPAQAAATPAKPGETTVFILPGKK